MMMGHNGGPPIFETVHDLPSDMPKMHYFKCDIQALRKAIFDKPLDIRGAYISVLVALYEHQEPLPSEDGMAMLRCGIKDARLWRRVKGTLIELGLIYQRPSGRLSNPRFEEEITAYVTEFRNRQIAAIEREKKAKVARTLRSNYPVAKPQLSDSYGLANAQLADSYPIANEQLKASKLKKANEINEGTTTTVPQRTPQADHEGRLRARVLELDSNKEDKIKIHPHTGVVAAQGAREGEEDIGHGVYVNGKTIRHASFVINLDAIRMQTLNSGLSANETSTHCQGHALQWAAEIENGKLARDVVPSKIANFLAATITATAHRGAQQSVRIARANRGYPSADPSKPEESTEDRWARMAKIPSKPEVKK